MKLETMRGQVRSVAQRWRAQYGKGRMHGADKQEIQRRLDALDVETATAADVTAIIGNSSWAGPHECHECRVTTWDAVELGEPPDYESRTATICIDCLRKAVALVEQSNAMYTTGFAGYSGDDDASR